MESHTHEWDLEMSDKCATCNRQLECDHFFVFEEEKSEPSALGTHRSLCSKCGLNYFAYVACEISRRIKEGIPTEHFHVHVWDSEMRRCGSRLRNGERCKDSYPI